jgi:hypothetical protein
MPNVDVLSRVQQNELLKLFENAGLSRDQWQVESVTEPYAGESLQYRHVPTGAKLAVTLIAGRFHLEWRPAIDGTTSSRHDYWADTAQRIAQWVATVALDHRAPDLWAAVGAETAIRDAAQSDDFRAQFTSEELRLLRAGLDEIERFITATQPLDGGRDVVKRRFDYLRESAGAGVRKIDWLNIFVGQVVGMVVQGLIPPSAYPAIMGHAATALSTVYNLGLKLLT